MVETLVDHRPLALTARTAPAHATTRTRVQPAATAAALIAARPVIIAAPPRLMRGFAPGTARGAGLVLRLVARITRLAAIFIVRFRRRAMATPAFGPGFAAVRSSVGLQMGNRFGGFGLGRFFGARGRNGFAQLRKDFLQHDKW
jgi:hypothetical protein